MVVYGRNGRDNVGSFQLALAFTPHLCNNEHMIQATGYFFWFTFTRPGGGAGGDS